jgi:hypothetical protein
MLQPTSITLLVDHHRSTAQFAGCKPGDTSFGRTCATLRRNLLLFRRERANRGEITETLVRKIMQDNPIAFYGL